MPKSAPRQSRTTPRQAPPSRAELPAPLHQAGLDELIGYHLRLAQIAVFRDFAEATRGFDMSPGWVGLLTLIQNNPGLTQSRLAAAIGIDRSTLVNSLDRLQERGLVQRAASALDKRANVLTLTLAGEQLLTDIMPRITAHETRLKAFLGDEQAALLLRSLARLAELPATPA